MKTDSGRNVTVGRDVHGSAIVTGDGNTVYVIAGELDADLLERLKGGTASPEDVPAADPLPHLTLRIRTAEPPSQTWSVTPLTPAGHRREDGSFLEPGEPRSWPVPWRGLPSFGRYLESFWKLTARALEADHERPALHTAALALGEALTGVLLPQEIEHLRAIGRADGPPPFLVIDADDDLVLSLPWELLRFEGRWPVLDGRLDLARTIPAPGAPQLEPPARPLSLLVNVSAPSGSGLDYEAESYRISRALHDHARVRINEMGELDDLVSGLAGEDPPVGVHFSGHGGRGTLQLEDSLGQAAAVTAGDLAAALSRAKLRWPRLFYLGCCHGHSPPAPRLAGRGAEWEKGVTSTAAQLHREGITQVVGHFGPVYDVQATAAEEAFYRALGQGRRTRAAIQAARLSMARPFEVGVRQTQRDPDSKELPGGWLPGSTPFAWAQLVLYHRGPDYPLGLPVPQRYAEAEEAPPQREVANAFSGSRTQVLLHGFIGRRRELHRLRRDLKSGRHLHVVQGLGGLGKSAFCQEALKLYRRQGRLEIALWCADVEDDADPAAALVRQFLDLAAARFGNDWVRLSAALDRRMGLEQSGRRLAAFLGALLAQDQVPPLVLYLDNLESLMTPPVDADLEDPELVADWRDEDCGLLWNELVELAERSAGRLALLASCRYRHPDLRRRLFSFPPLSSDAIFRMMGWFPNLRKLSGPSRGRLVKRLSGHPRAVEMLDPLIGREMEVWLEVRGSLPVVVDEEGAEREWERFVKPGLPELHEKLSENLLLAALWKRMLGEGERRLLVRLTVLRRPAPFEWLLPFAESEAMGERSLRRLIEASLLGEFREQRPTGEVDLAFAVHPMVTALLHGLAVRYDDWRLEGFQIAATEWRQQLRAPNVEMGLLLDCGHYLVQSGQADHAAGLLWPVAQHLGDLGRYREGFEILAELVGGTMQDVSPENRAIVEGVRGGCFVGLGALSLAAEAFSQATEIQTEQLKAEPANTSLARNLSVSHNKVGDVMLAKGDLEGALEAFQNSRHIRERLAQQDPANAGWQRDLSVSHNKVGDVMLAKGDLEGAVEAFQNSRHIIERLAQQDPANAGWQRDLSVSQEKVGDVMLAKGDLEGAVEAFQNSRHIRERLAQQDPANAGWQRDLSVSHNKVGDVMLAKGDLEGAVEAFQNSRHIRERLAQQDPANAGWQRDLSVSHNKVGDVMLAKGDLEGAVEAFQEDLRIAERLAQQDPANAGWQRDLSVSQEKVGDVMLAKGDLEGALEAFQNSRHIRERLVELNPSHPEWQADLARVRKKIEEVATGGKAPDEVPDAAGGKSL